QQFGGLSQVTFELYGPVIGERTSQEYRDLGDGFYGEMLSEVRKLDLDGELGDPVAQSAAAPSAAGDPTMTVYLIFADWGLEDVDPNDAYQWLHDHNYFIGRNAPYGTDLGDIRQAGGSRGGYRGVHSQIGPYGAGIVTEEGWKHPEIRGTAIVAYHEGLGHSLGMPHPADDVATGVMGQAMYRTTLENSYVEPSILIKMLPDMLVAPWIAHGSLMVTEGGRFDGFRVRFSEEIDPETFTADDITLTIRSQMPIAAPFTAAVTEIVPQANGREFELRIDPIELGALVQIDVAIGHEIADLSGDLLDQNQNRNPGQPTWDDYFTRRRYESLSNVPVLDIDPWIFAPRDWFALRPEDLLNILLPIPSDPPLGFPRVTTTLAVDPELNPPLISEPRLANDLLLDEPVLQAMVLP
ncbi:MAG: hypothetical protein ACREIV_11935, partial [Planctomycetaceae bacterium]